MKGKILLVAILAAFALTAFGATSVQAAGHTDPTSFAISVKHNVKGDEIGLSREAPVLIQVILDGRTLAYLPMMYGDRLNTNLPGGVYEFIFWDQESGARLFDCGPYAIANGDDVRVQAHEQGPGRIPTCYVK